MIKCVFEKYDGLFTEFRVHGHSGFSSRGRDIVCAAVSSVVQHTARALGRDGARVKVSDGLLEVSCIGVNEVSQRFVYELFETLTDLSNQYPKHVAVEVNQCEDRHTALRKVEWCGKERKG